MPNVLGQKNNCAKITSERWAAIDSLLTEGIRIGPDSKRRAINKVLRDFPEVTRGDCWHRIRHLRKTPELSHLPERQRRSGQFQSSKADRQPPRRWTSADNDRLLNWVGHEGVDKIAQRLNRSERAIRYRLCALGMSAKVSDGWSLRALRKLLRVSAARLKQLIAVGMLRVRDSRVSVKSLAEFCHRNRASLDPAAMERIATAMTKKRDAYPWELAAELLGLPLSQVQSWIADGQLKLQNTFVTDHSFEEFCKKHSDEINIGLIDPETAKWLIEEYGVRAPSPERWAIPRAQKHALVVRTCKCGKKIAGNPYFRHTKACKAAAYQAVRQAAYESRARGKALGGSI